MKNIAIIGCTSKKKNNACTAIELYQASPFFCKELTYVKSVIKASDIYILSAEHHLIHSSKNIAPYNKTLLKMRKADREAWAKIVLLQIVKEFNSQEHKLYLLCGKRYYELLEPELIKKGYQYEIPLKNKGKIGEQLQWLNLQNKKIGAKEQ